MRSREVNMPQLATAELLEGFLAAFNRHDLDAIMEYSADECVFYMPRGKAPRGDQYIGKAAARAGLAQRFAGIPNVHYGEDQHWVCGKRRCVRVDPDRYYGVGQESARARCGSSGICRR
jgi:ketosteroid isomerase-like protein